MPNEPQDIVVEARAKLAKPNYGMGKRNRELMTQLCDEVERLRKSNKSMADELGHQDSYWDDPLRGNFKC